MNWNSLNIRQYLKLILTEMRTRAIESNIAYYYSSVFLLLFDVRNITRVITRTFSLITKLYPDISHRCIIILFEKRERNKKTRTVYLHYFFILTSYIITVPWMAVFDRY